MRIVPDGVVALATDKCAALDRITVGEQDGRGLEVRFEAHGVDRQHVRAVDTERDPAEALRFTLRTVDAAR